LQHSRNHLNQWIELGLQYIFVIALMVYIELKKILKWKLHELWIAINTMRQHRFFVTLEIQMGKPTSRGFSLRGIN